MSSDWPDTVSGVHKGDVLAGKYRVSGIIGAGGMGVVVAAHHIHLDEKVAIKVLHPNVLGMAEAVDRFVREARAVVKIKSQHVVRVSDVDRLPNGSPYMVMEYLEGLDLAAWIEKRGALEIEQAVEFVLQACEAVADAHALGIVHRDLKPANLFCVRSSDGRPFVKVLDFGISKAISTDTVNSEPGITGTNAMLGSPLYMSPEQMRASRDVDARTDIWSIGIILYELLAGKVPFEGSAIPEICVRVTTQPAPPLSTHRSDIPAELEAIINKCLQKERSSRYVNIAELAMALAPFGPRRSRDSAERISRVLHEAGLSGTAMTFPPSSQQSVQKNAADSMAGLGYTSPGLKRRRLVKLSIALGIIAVAAAIGAVTLLKKMPSVTASGLPTISPATSAVSLLENSASVAVSAVPITLGLISSATGKPLGTPSNPTIGTGASVQGKAVTTKTTPSPAKVVPIPQAAAPGAKRESSNLPSVARNSPPAPQIDTGPAASNAHRAVVEPTPSNNFGGRL